MLSLSLSLSLFLSLSFYIYIYILGVEQSLLGPKAQEVTRSQESSWAWPLCWGESSKRDHPWKSWKLDRLGCWRQSWILIRVFLDLRSWRHDKTDEHISVGKWIQRKQTSVKWTSIWTDPTKGTDPRWTNPIKGDAWYSRGSHVAGSAHQESWYGKALYPMPNHNWGSSIGKTIPKNLKIWWRVLPVRKGLPPQEIKVKSTPLYNPQNPFSQRYA